MPLVEHLRELRRRLVISVLVITVAFIPAWLHYADIFAYLKLPLDGLLSDTVKLQLSNITDPFTLQIQVSLVTALVATSPIWLFQIWRFVTPGLHKHERRWAYFFIFTATPLAFLGAAMAYWTLPISLQLLIGFTPESVTNLIAVDKYFEFVFRMILVFAVGFLSPLFFILLNFAGLLSAATIRSWWRIVIMIVLVFAAVATPTGDPVTMSLVASPILVLMVLAWVVAAVNDWRRRRAGAFDEDPELTL
jgi:sec-independent protein translocase protein TatC